MAMPFAKLLHSEPGGDRTISLDRAMTTLGRLPGQDLVFRDPSVSRQHAAILRDDGAYTLVDQKSTHGTFVNGTKVERATLETGDVIRLGSLTGPRLEFYLPMAAETPRTPSYTATQDLLNSLSELSLSVRRASPPAPEMVQLNWLLTAARRLNEVGAIDDILGALLQSTLELTGLERGFVFIQKGDEMQMRRGRDAEGAEIHDDSTISRRAILQALSNGSPFSVSDSLADEVTAEWSSLKTHGIRSIYCIPLCKRSAAADAEDLLGLLYLDSQVGSGKLTEVDHQLLEMIATEAAALLHNALLAEAEYNARQAREELAVAATIHRGLMSITLPQLPYASIEARSRPCLAIGGDFYDAVALEGSVAITIADVSGKGVSAAIVAATLQGIIHAQMLSGHSLAEIAALVNRFLCARSVGKYATMVMLNLRPDGRLEYLNCGHVQPMAIYNDGERVQVRRLEEANTVVGLISTATYVSSYMVLRPGERLLLATDGVTEAEDRAGTLFGERLDETIARTCDLDDLLREATSFQGSEDALGSAFQDDCTLLQLRYQG